MYRGNKKDIIKKGLLYSSILVLFIFIIESTIYFNSTNQAKKKLLVDELTKLRYIDSDVSLLFDRVAVDLSYITKNEMAIRYLETGDDEAYKDLLSLINICAEDEGVYDQVRILDSTGMEKIRVNKGSNHNYLVPNNNLQNKSSRYYFTDAMKIGANNIYTSPFDLNKEHGKIEQPIKPMIRYGKEFISDNDSTRVLGVAIINFLGQIFIDRVKSHNNESGRLCVVNKQGYFIIGPDSISEWRWMYSDSNNTTLQSKYPQIWETIKDKPAGNIECDSGIIVFNKILISPKVTNISGNIRELIMLKLIPNTYIHSVYKNTLDQLIFVFIFVVPVLVFMAFRLGAYQVNQRILINKLQDQAMHDPLTNLLNRRAVLHKLKLDMKLAKRRGSPLSIAFIDLNNLKKINDSIGHEAGDTLIVGASETLSETLRETDYAARLGGDEFLAVFPDCSHSDADAIVERIKENFKTHGKSLMKIPWSLSVGVSTFKNDERPEDFIIRADSRMYEEKVAFKNSESTINS